MRSNLVQIHTDAECDECGNVVSSHDRDAWEVPVVTDPDDWREPNAPVELPMRIHAQCLPAYLFRVLGENEPTALLGLVRR